MPLEELVRPRDVGRQAARRLAGDDLPRECERTVQEQCAGGPVGVRLTLVLGLTLTGVIGRMQQLLMEHGATAALKMVDDLFRSPGAGQEVDANVFANDVVTAQTAEIGIMRRLLSQLPSK